MTFCKETSFDSTSIGNIPSEWKVVTLEQVTASHKQGFYTSDSYSDKGVRLARITDLLDPKICYETMPFLEVDDRTYEQFKVEIGDFLFARSGAIGRHGIITEDIPCIFAAYIIRFRFDQTLVSNYFLSYLFQANFVKNEFLSKMHGATNININAENIKSIRIPLPSLLEQNAIVGVLGVVDSAIQYADRVIAKSERLKRGLMQQLLTRGIGHTETKQTPIGNIPKTWEVARLADVSEIIMGQSPPGETYNEEGHGSPLINGPSEFGEECPIKAKWTTEPTKFSEKNDVLICVRGHTTGRLSISDDAYCIGRGVAAIRASEQKMSNRFLFYILEENQSKIFQKSYAAGSTFPNITRVELGKTPVALPPLSEQRQIADILTEIDHKLKLEAKEKHRLERLKVGLMDLLLTGKVRIRMD